MCRAKASAWSRLARWSRAATPGWPPPPSGGPARSRWPEWPARRRGPASRGRARAARSDSGGRGRAPGPSACDCPSAPPSTPRCRAIMTWSRPACAGDPSRSCAIASSSSAMLTSCRISDQGCLMCRRRAATAGCSAATQKRSVETTCLPPRAVQQVERHGHRRDRAEDRQELEQREVQKIHG